jgi:predicted Zn-dependent peptidase
MQKEKGVIIEEINMYEDLPPRHVQDLMMKLLYKNQPAGWNIAGEKKNILKMKREDFVQYKKEHYVPSATTIVVAGNVTLKQVKKEVEKVFGKIAKQKKSPKIKVIEKQNKPEALIKFKETDQSHFVLAFRSFGFLNKKNVILTVLAGILGGGMSSRLFQKLREEMGVGYYVRAYNDLYSDHGFFQISAGVDNKRVFEVIQAILLECQKLKKEKVSEDELEKVKECLIGNMKLSLESTDDIASFYGGQELLKKEIKSAEEKAQEIRKVNAQQVLNLAQEILKEEKLNLALIGPFKDKKDFLKILKF